MSACGSCARRVQISDGELSGIGVVTSDMAALITSEEVVINQLVVLKEYLINSTPGGSKVCIIMQMMPVAVEEGA